MRQVFGGNAECELLSSKNTLNICKRGLVVSFEGEMIPFLAL